jgi:thiol-disulfide isomerase/thioredoxin
MKRKICLLALLWPVLNSCAQQTGIKPLSVGDTIPPIILTDVVNFPVSKIHLSSYRGKLLIIDFWATWCNSCIKSFPKLDSLQTRFASKIQFVLINHFPSSGNTAELVSGFFAKRPHLLTNLRSIPLCNDASQRLKQLFPHTFIPHYIWVGPAGNILAITNSEAVNVVNISNAISGRPLALPVKKE